MAWHSRSPKFFRAMTSNIIFKLSPYHDRRGPPASIATGGVTGSVGEALPRRRVPAPVTLSRPLTSAAVSLEGALVTRGGAAPRNPSVAGADTGVGGVSEK